MVKISSSIKDKYSQNLQKIKKIKRKYKSKFNIISKRRLKNIKIYGSSTLNEYKGFLLLKCAIGDKGILKKTNEGCKADALFKPFDDDHDRWIPIQIKTTNRFMEDGYKFCNCSNYKKYVMCCISLKYKQCWLFNSNICMNIKTVNITTKDKGKYGKYLCPLNNIYTKLCEHYYNNSFAKITLNHGMCPITSTRKVEYYYKCLRQKKLPWLKIKNVEIENSVVDVMINGKKVQDKTGYSRIGYKYAIIVNIVKHYGNLKRGPYYKNDNHYYWINLPHPWKTTHFYLIPQHELIKHGYISNKYNKGKTKLILYPGKDKTGRKTEWARKYLLSYKNINTKLI